MANILDAGLFKPIQSPNEYTTYSLALYTLQNLRAHANSIMKEVSIARNAGFHVSDTMDLSFLPESSLVLDGGNLMVNDEGECALTNDLYYPKGWGEKTPPKEDRQAEKLLTESIGCKQLRVIDVLPGEGSGHIDVIEKYVGADADGKPSVLVAQLDNVPYDQKECKTAWQTQLEKSVKRFNEGIRVRFQHLTDEQIQDYLNQEAESLQNAGYHVERVPIFHNGKINNVNDGSALNDEPPSWWFQSYVNSVLIYDVSKNKKNIIFSTFTHENREQHQREVSEAMKRIGYDKVGFVNADALAKHTPNAAWHCATMHIPDSLISCGNN
jgi:Porphyromonas-type peptidyl-arginine deiminase